MLYLYYTVLQLQEEYGDQSQWLVCAPIIITELLQFSLSYCSGIMNIGQYEKCICNQFTYFENMYIRRSSH